MQQVALEALEEKVVRPDPEEWLRVVRDTARKHGTQIGSEAIVSAVREGRA